MAFVGEPWDETISHLISSRETTSSSVYRFDPETAKLVSLMVISLCIAFVSVLAALFAFYMFVRMRRVFHHDLVMLLIQSDLMKSFWLVSSSLAYFIHGPVDSSGTFCQVSGFFLAAAIQSADIAVLMIALHTALTLLRPGRSAGGGAGLYPYRRVAYLCWAVIPLALAAVVPLTGDRFIDEGPNCYLPITPTWYRLMLSWVPRYIIFIIIILTYVGIYVYVRLQLARFCVAQRRASTHTMPMSPCIEAHFYRRGTQRSSGDLAPRPVACSELAEAAFGGEPRDRQFSATSTITMLKQVQQPTVPIPARLAQREPVSWKPVNYGDDNSLQQPRMQRPQSYIPSETDIEMANPRTRSTTEEHHDDDALHAAVPPPAAAARSRLHFWRRSPTRRHSRDGDGDGNNDIDSSRGVIAETLHNIRSILYRHESPQRQRSDSMATTAVGSAEIDLPTDETQEAMRRSRDRMQRQLRLLFVYPTIYVLEWIAPCIWYGMGYDHVFVDQYHQQKRALAMIAEVVGRSVVGIGPGTEGGGGGVSGSDNGLRQQQQPPFALQVVTITSLCISGALDCGFFTAWEQPWRHLQHGFFEGLRLRLRPRLRLCFHFRFRLPEVVRRGGSGGGGGGGSGSSSPNGVDDAHRNEGGSGDNHRPYYYPYYQRRPSVGRTREERARDARHAHLRRDQEDHERMTEAMGGQGQGRITRHDRPALAREWWDLLDDVDDDDDVDVDVDVDVDDEKKKTGGGHGDGGPHPPRESRTSPSVPDPDVE